MMRGHPWNVAAERKRSAIYADEDYRRDLKVEDERAARAAAEMTDEARIAVERERAELEARIEAKELAEAQRVLEAVPCSECGARAGEACFAGSTEVHYGRRAAFNRTF